MSGKLSEAHRRIAILEDELASHNDLLSSAMQNRNDEVHCGCCAPLRAEVTRLSSVDTFNNELLAHEHQTHQALGEILGTDDSFVVLAQRVVERNKELEPLADIVLYNQRVLAEAGALNMSHEAHIEGLNKRISELETLEENLLTNLRSAQRTCRRLGSRLFQRKKK